MARSSRKARPPLSQRRKSAKRKMLVARNAKFQSSRRLYGDSVRENDDLPPLIIETTKEPTSWDKLRGNRIFSPGIVIPSILRIESSHTRKCTAGTLQFKTEIRKGLNCKWLVECDTCHREYQILNEENEESTLNPAGAWAALSSGIGFAQFENILSLLNVPFMCQNTFIKQECDIEKVLKDHLDATMKEAGKEEREQAILNGDIDGDGVPFITVIVDGAWSKRSYGHNYNSSSGVAVIIGQRTGKLLFVGVRNKYCCICERAVKQQTEVKQHVCYKNWEKSRASTAMEQDVIVEGFCHSVDMHGIKYKYFVGDGDSSVYARIMEKVPYGRSVFKMECANHCVRNYTSHLHVLAADKTYPPDARKLFRSAIPRLTAAARGAIRHCGKNKEEAEQLAKDLINGPYHVFGDHSKCRDYFCSLEETKNILPVLQESGLFEQVQSIVQRLVAKAPRLKENKTSNAAENYMSLVAKFSGGKRVNYSQRGSFQRRCHMAALRFQKGLAWEQSPYKKMIGKSPGSTHKKVVAKNTRHQSATRRKLAYQEDMRTVRKRCKMHVSKPDADYGSSADQVVDLQECELSANELLKKCNDYIASLQVTRQERESISEKTVMQADCDLWHDMRRVMLTASNFGIVCRRKDSTPCSNLVKQLLYKPPITTPAIEYGRRNEHLAIQKFREQTGLTVEKCGLVVDLDYGFLGASPDGLVPEENAVIEVKCVPSAINLGIHEIAKRNKNFFLKLNDDESLALKRTHPYYYQLQGTINITERDFGYFIVMSDVWQNLHTEKIQKDENMWKTEMLPKLVRFYRSCLLPEIVAPNISRGKAIREPEYILEAQKNLAYRQKTRLNKHEDEKENV